MTQKFVTPGETHEERAEFWLKIIAQARSYPGGIQKFCRDHGIGKEVYYHWFHELKGRSASWQTPLDTNQKRRKNPPKQKSGRMDPRRPPREWRALVQECKQSGLVPSAFAREKGLQKVTFCRWYRRLFSLSEQKPVENDVIKESLHEKAEFVPVRVLEAAKQSKNDDEPVAVEIVLANQRVIRVNSSCTPDFLKVILSVVEDR